MEDKLVVLCEDVSALKTGLNNVEEKIDRLTYYLQGNGRPGILSELQAEDKRIEAQSQAEDKRIVAMFRPIEARINKGLGAITAASTLVIAAFELIRFLKHV